MSNSSDFLGSQGKILDLLLYIINKKGKISLEEICDLFKLSKSGSYRILNILIKKGFLEHKKGESKFYLSKKIFDISKSLIFNEPIYLIIEKRISELGEKLNEDAFLFKIENNSLKIVSSFAKREYDSSFPLYATSFGKVILSFLDEKDLEGVLKRINLEQITKFTKTKLKDLRNEFKKIKSDGYNISIEEFKYGFFDIAVPVIDKVEKNIYSLGVIASKMKLSESFLEEALNNLKEIKNKIEKDLLIIYKFK